MNLQSIVILLVIFVLFAFAAVYIAKNGGWQGGCGHSGGCGGNCAGCNQHCDSTGLKKSESSNATTQEKAQDN